MTPSLTEAMVAPWRQRIPAKLVSWLVTLAVVGLVTLEVVRLQPIDPMVPPPFWPTLIGKAGSVAVVCSAALVWVAPLPGLWLLSSGALMLGLAGDQEGNHPVMWLVVAAGAAILAVFDQAQAARQRRLAQGWTPDVSLEPLAPGVALAAGYRRRALTYLAWGLALAALVAGAIGLLGQSVGSPAIANWPRASGVVSQTNQDNYPTQVTLPDGSTLQVKTSNEWPTGTEVALLLPPDRPGHADVLVELVASGAELLGLGLALGTAAAAAFGARRRCSIWAEEPTGHLLGPVEVRLAGKNSGKGKTVLLLPVDSDRPIGRIYGLIPCQQVAPRTPAEPTTNPAQLVIAKSWPGALFNLSGGNARDQCDGALQWLTARPTERQADVEPGKPPESEPTPVAWAKVYGLGQWGHELAITVDGQWYTSRGRLQASRRHVRLPKQSSEGAQPIEPPDRSEPEPMPADWSVKDWVEAGWPIWLPWWPFFGKRRRPRTPSSGAWQDTSGVVHNTRPNQADPVQPIWDLARLLQATPAPSKALGLSPFRWRLLLWLALPLVPLALFIGSNLTTTSGAMFVVGMVILNIGFVYPLEDWWQQAPEKELVAITRKGLVLSGYLVRNLVPISRIGSVRCQGSVVAIWLEQPDQLWVMWGPWPMADGAANPEELADIIAQAKTASDSSKSARRPWYWRPNWHSIALLASYTTVYVISAVWLFA